MRMNEPIETTPEEITMVANQLVANPADGTVKLSLAENGSLYAEWAHKGERASVGPTWTESLD